MNPLTQTHIAFPRYFCQSSNQPKKSQLLKKHGEMSNKLNIKQPRINNNTLYEIKSNVNYAIEINRWQLKILGIWPLPTNASYFDIILANILIIIVWFLLAFLLIPGMYFINNLESVGVKIRLSGPLSFCVMAIMKYFSLITGRSHVSKCLEHLITDWYNVTCVHDRNIMMKKAQQGRYGASICAIFMYGGAVFYSLILPNISGGDKNMSDSNITTRPFAYPSYYGFFDPQESPVYEIIFSIHCCCAFVMHSVTSTACSIAVIFIMHACGQLEVISVWMMNLDNQNSDTNEIDKSLAKIIRHHSRTLSFINDVDKILCNICLVEVLGCTMNICLLGNGLMLQWGHYDAIGIMTYLILLISFTLNIFLFCYIGELLTEQCKRIGERLYMINWYNLPQKNAFGLILTIMTSQRPIILTAGKLIDLSLNSFSSIIRTAVAYLNLVRTYMG